MKKVNDLEDQLLKFMKSETIDLPDTSLNDATIRMYRIKTKTLEDKIVELENKILSLTAKVRID